MNKALVIIVGLVAILGVGGLWVLASRPNDEPQTSSETASVARGEQPQDNTATPSNTPSDGNASERVVTDEVEIEDMAYRPANITVKKGTTVTWTNKDEVRHDVRPDEESDAFQGSELLAKDERYSFTFNTPGTYSYHCSPHPHMTGTVTVIE